MSALKIIVGSVGVLFILAFWAFVLYFIASWGWWALLAVPAYGLLVGLIIEMCAPPKPIRHHRGKTW